MPLRRLLGMLRDERRYVATRDPVESCASWSDIATDGGYADQVHFCRETRRASGITPNEVKRCIANEEGYWIYRIWS